MGLQYDTDLRNRLSAITNMGTSQNNASLQLAQIQQQRAAQEQQARLQQMQQQAMQKAISAQQSASQPTMYAPNVNLTGAPTGKGNTFESFLGAISGQESGGNYGIVNKDSGALGKYQIMPGNIASWSKAALGHSITPQQFLRSPQLQEQIAQYHLRNYYNNYGPAGAAVAWYAGEGTAKNYVRNPGAYNKPQGNYPSINAYALSILKKMGLR